MFRLQMNVSQFIWWKAVEPSSPLLPTKLNRNCTPKHLQLLILSGFLYFRHASSWRYEAQDAGTPSGCARGHQRQPMASNAPQARHGVRQSQLIARDTHEIHVENC